MSENTERQFPESFDPERLKSLEEIREAGIDPYPYSYPDSRELWEILDSFEHLQGQIVRTTGRITSRREMGKTSFMDLTDGPARIQLYVRRDSLGEDFFRIVNKKLDIGDFIGVEGEPFVTKMGERSLNVKSLTVLAKGVVYIPYGKKTEEKTFYAITDVETKRQERVLDWLTDPESLQRFTQRFRILSWIREYMNKLGFLEVDTPVLEPLYGGAEARPFTTSIWALDNQKAYLRISPELYLKRYIVSGFPRVYTICKNFRNENIDATHNPEFTMMEWYEAFTDYEFQMGRFEALVCHLVERHSGGLKIPYRGREIDFTPPWPRLRVPELVEARLGKTYEELTHAELVNRMAEAGFDPEKVARAPQEPKGALVMDLLEHGLEPDLWNPCFLCDLPEDISPLTKQKRGRPGFVERFEPYAAGMEIGNAYSELTDPVEQYRRFAAQREAQKGMKKDYEDNPLDLDFLKAVGYGMPPTGGVGLGVDRLIMILLGIESIRDIIPFPMRRGE